LNSILYRFEKNLALFSTELGLNASKYHDAANNREIAIRNVLFETNTYLGGGLWADYNLTSKRRQPISKGSLSISQWIPLWAGLAGGLSAEQLVGMLFQSGLLQNAGVLTTDAIKTNQQWDSPNAWAPLVMLTIDGLVELNIPTSIYLAENISNAWLRTCYIAYNRTGFMYEKYNAYIAGFGGGGGEYEPQVIDRSPSEL
jgi:alpha,alpha-trehalase